VYQVYLPVLIDVPPPIPTPTPTWTPSPTLAPSATQTATVEVLGLAHPKDVVVRTDTHDIYVTSRDNNRVYRLDGATLAEEGSAVVGAQPWGIDYNPNTNKLYVADFASGDVRVLDASTLAVLRVINTGPSPTFVRVDPGSNKVYAVLYGSNALAVIDGATDTLETLAPAGGVGSWGIALNPALNRVYVSNRDSGTVTTLDGNAGYSVLGGLTRVVCGSGGSSPYAMDFNPSNNRLYVACAPNGSVNTAAIYKANSTGLTFMTFAPLGNGGPDGGGGVVANPATGLVYFTNGDADSVTIIDGSNQVAGAFATGSHPFGIALDPITGRVYVVNRDSNDLTVH
jgi:YVTN family beta-propeller protein